MALPDGARPSNFIDAYLHYVGDTESPVTFHRWSILSTLSAWLGKRFYIKHGHSRIDSNMYCMLMGAAGTRKSTAIKIASKLIRKAGYSTFSASKTSKEQFLADLAKTGMPSESSESNEILDMNLWGAENDTAESSMGSCELFVNADEFNDFVGNGNIEFLSLLGNLWDLEGDYRHSKLTSKSVFVKDPCVSILAGNTATGFSLAFPKEAIGQGIFSRLLLIHGESTNKRIAFPAPPPDGATEALITCLLQIRAIAVGEAEIDPDAKALLSYIYNEWTHINDIRFESYCNRRFTHLLKLCLIHAAARKSRVIEQQDVIMANTVLTHAEHSMPRALGEFGAASKSDVTNKVMNVCMNTANPLSFKDIWKHVSNEVNSLTELRPIIENLMFAEKIIKVGSGYMAKRQVIQEKSKDRTIDFSLLTPSEREYLAQGNDMTEKLTRYKRRRAARGLPPIRTPGPSFLHNPDWGGIILDIKNTCVPYAQIAKTAGMTHYRLDKIIEGHAMPLWLEGQILFEMHAEAIEYRNNLEAIRKEKETK